jgi:hypothetical protein
MLGRAAATAAACAPADPGFPNKPDSPGTPRNAADHDDNCPATADAPEWYPTIAATSAAHICS